MPANSKPSPKPGSTGGKPPAAASNKNSTDPFICSKCHNPISGDMQELVRHMLSCHANDSPSTAGRPADAPAGSPTTKTAGGSRWTIFTGGSALKSNAVEDELAMVSAMYSDNLVVTNREADGKLPKIGDRLEFLAPHCDPTVNLYDRIYAMRGDKVEAAWPIVARRG